MPRDAERELTELVAEGASADVDQLFRADPKTAVDLLRALGAHGPQEAASGCRCGAPGVLDEDGMCRCAASGARLDRHADSKLASRKA